MSKSEYWQALETKGAAYSPLDTLSCWVEDERTIHLKVFGTHDGALELTSAQARELAEVLERFALRIE